MSTQQNPANTTTPDVSARKRIPMSIPTRKLEVPDIEGFHLHWFLDKNVARALQGGYEFVKEDEVPVNQKGVGTDSSISGNADLGSHIRVVAGTGEGGQAQYLTLMKIRKEWWDEDQKVLEKRNTDILSAIFRDEKIIGEEQAKPEDRKQAYVDKDRTSFSGKPLLQRPMRKDK